jgi:transposase InsO family protein
LFGVDRQIYYRSIKRGNTKRDKAEKVVAMVTELRQMMPRLGGRKMYYLLQTQLEGLSIGRDKFFAILKANHLLIVPKRTYHVTTNSMHRFKKHDNLLIDITIERPNQVWVADITYIGKRANPIYLSLITDAYSKKIVGYYVADNLSTESSIWALKMALKERKDKSESLVHHSDREYNIVLMLIKKYYRKIKSYVA